MEWRALGRATVKQADTECRLGSVTRRPLHRLALSVPPAGRLAERYPSINLGCGSKVSGAASVGSNVGRIRGHGGFEAALYLDGELVARGVGGSHSCTWKTRKLTAGIHSLQAVAQRAAGNETTASISVGP